MSEEKNYKIKGTDWMEYGKDCIITSHKKTGIADKDGVVIVEPIYDYIKIEDYLHRVFVGYIEDKEIETTLFLNTFGDGFLCAEENNVQFIMNTWGKKIVVFNDDWFRTNGLSVHKKIINAWSLCKFENGSIVLDILEGKDYYVNIRISKEGYTEYVNDYWTDNNYYTAHDYYRDNPDIFEGMP